MEDPAVRAFLEGALYEEIIPTLSLPREDCEAFARAVEERFANPYIDHRLLDIALNSVSKWRAPGAAQRKGLSGGGRTPARAAHLLLRRPGRVLHPGHAGRRTLSRPG